MVAGKMNRLLSCFVSTAMVLALVPVPALAEVADEVAPPAVGAELPGEGEPLPGQTEGEEWGVLDDPVTIDEGPDAEGAWDEDGPTGGEETVEPDQGETAEGDAEDPEADDEFTSPRPRSRS